jgi:hypothetical protein
MTNISDSAQNRGPRIVGKAKVGDRLSGQRGRKETEQLQVIVGEWYWGVKCPECGAMAAHVPDPTQGQGDSTTTSGKPADAQVTMTCPNGHRFSARTENLLRFEWGAQ